MKDEFHAHGFAQVWTPPHGTAKRLVRRKARTALKRALLRLIGIDDHDSDDEIARELSAEPPGET